MNENITLTLTVSEAETLWCLLTSCWEDNRKRIVNEIHENIDKAADFSERGDHARAAHCWAVVTGNMQYIAEIDKLNDMLFEVAWK